MRGENKRLRAQLAEKIAVLFAFLSSVCLSARQSVHPSVCLSEGRVYKFLDVF